MQKKISIIIPVYNVEKYIERCIKSVLNQDLKPNEYEILVVDDESPDNSVSIVKRLQLDNPQIHLYRQKNKGLGGARNTGIINAKGKYLLFLDADDYLEKNAISTILDYCIDNDLDILEFGAVGVTEQKKEIYRKSIATHEIIDGYSYLYKNQYMNSACNKLYSSSFLKKNKLFFKERIFIEDFEFNTRAFYYANRVIGVDIIVSNFVQTSNSITRNRNIKKNKKMVFDINKVIDITLLFSNTIKDRDKTTQIVINERVGFLIITMFYTMLKLNISKEIRTDMIKDLKTRNLYPVKTRINDKRKNLFKIVVNNELIFSIACDLKLFITNKL